MVEIRDMSISVLDWEMRYLLQSLQNELERLKVVSQLGDDDNAIDAANDFIELTGLYERLSNDAIATFGNQITDFSNTKI